MDQLKEFLKNEIQELIFTDVNFDDSLIESGLLDSITLVDLIVLIEEKYDINVPNSDIKPENFETINLLVSYLENQ